MIMSMPGWETKEKEWCKQIELTLRGMKRVGPFRQNGGPIQSAKSSGSMIKKKDIVGVATDVICY